MQTQMDLAKQALFGQDGLRVSNVKLFPGSAREVTPEDMSAQVNSVISALTEGDYEDITDCDD